MHTEFQLLYTDTRICILKMPDSTGMQEVVEEIKRPQPRSPERIIKDYIERTGLRLVATTGSSSMWPTGFIASDQPEAIIV